MYIITVGFKSKFITYSANTQKHYITRSSTPQRGGWRVDTTKPKPDLLDHMPMPAHAGCFSPPCSMSESVRCVREKLAMLAGEMENLEQGDTCGQLCSVLRAGGGGEKYLDG